MGSVEQIRDEMVLCRRALWIKCVKHSKMLNRSFNVLFNINLFHYILHSYIQTQHSTVMYCLPAPLSFL